MDEIKCYRIGRCETRDIINNKQLNDPYYKVYVEHEDGNVWFICSFETKEKAFEYIRLSIEHPEIDNTERMMMAERIGER